MFISALAGHLRISSYDVRSVMTGLFRISSVPLGGIVWSGEWFGHYIGLWLACMYIYQRVLGTMVI